MYPIGMAKKYIPIFRERLRSRKSEVKIWLSLAKARGTQRPTFDE
jgi:hypothetical protein